MTCGVYQIVNLVNGKCYVGSSISVHFRWKTHLKCFQEHKHVRKFQNAWNKYKEQNFEFLILEYCTREELIEREQFWIDFLDSCKRGYNSRARAEGPSIGAGPNRGRKFSLEVRAKMSAAHKGRATWNKGIPATEEHKKNVSDALLKKHPFKGKAFSSEVRQRMSEAQKASSALRARNQRGQFS